MPVLFLTARDDEMDRILGLELGADDYLVKPFSPREMVARVRAILRRTREGPAPQEVIALGEVEVDVRRREARRSGEVVALTTREFDLLAFLANNVGLALTRQQLLDGVWGSDWYGDERTVDVHVAQLRKKLGPDFPWPPSGASATGSAERCAAASCWSWSASSRWCSSSPGRAA